MNYQPKIITEETAKKLAELLSKGPISASKSLELAKKPVLHIRNSQILAGVTGTIGLVMFALGVENFINTIPELSSPFVEIGLGLFLLAISGLLIKKLV